ncbi:hypothetical protein MXB_3778, partial [Myxobolus squamalis]
MKSHRDLVVVGSTNLWGLAQGVANNLLDNQPISSSNKLNLIVNNDFFLDELKAAFLALINNPTNSDLIIKCRAMDQIQAHQVILQSRCPLVSEVKIYNIIKLIDVSGKYLDFSNYNLHIVTCFLKYVYSGKIEFFEEDLASLVDLASVCGCQSLINFLNSVNEKKVTQSLNGTILIDDSQSEIAASDCFKECSRSYIDDYADDNLIDYYAQNNNSLIFNMDATHSNHVESSEHAPVSVENTFPSSQPMYNTMSTPKFFHNLKDEIKKYGLKPMKKNKMVLMLNEIHKCSNSCDEELKYTEFDILNSKISKNIPTANEDNKSISINLNFNNFYAAIQENKEMFIKLLSFEPINVKELIKYLKCKNIVSNKTNLINFLNSQVLIVLYKVR